jgi:hypothetical protein
MTQAFALPFLCHLKHDEEFRANPSFCVCEIEHMESIAGIVSARNLSGLHDAISPVKSARLETKSWMLARHSGLIHFIP